jgi:hypothetical protein
MTPIRVTLALMLVIVAVLLAAVCVQEQPAGVGKVEANGTVTNTTIPAVVPLNHTECPQPVSLERSNYSMWIKMNPVSDHVAGDEFDINGTIQRKNQSEDFEKIYLIIERFGAHTGRGPQIVFEGVVDHYSGDCQVKPWSIHVTLSENLPSGRYDVIAETLADTPQWLALSYSFNLLQPRSSGSQIQVVTSSPDSAPSSPVTTP